MKNFLLNFLNRNLREQTLFLYFTLSLSLSLFYFFVRKFLLKNFNPLIFMALLFITFLYVYKRTGSDYIFLFFFLHFLIIGSYTYMYIGMMLLLVFILLLLLYRKKKKLKFKKEVMKIAWYFFLLFIYLFILYIAYQGNYSDFYTFPLFFITFFSYIVIGILNLFIKWNEQESLIMKRIIYGFVIAQTLVIYITSVINYDFRMLLTGIIPFVSLKGIKCTYGDYHTGLLMLCNLSTIYFLILFIIFNTFVIYRFKKYKSLKYLLLPINIYILWGCIMPETKHALAGIFISIFAFGIMILFKFKRNNFIPIFLLIILLAFAYSKSESIFHHINIHNIFTIKRGDHNYHLHSKIRLIRRAIRLIKKKPFMIITGYGPGTFGSHVSFRRMNNIYQSNSDKLPDLIPMLENRDYKMAMEGLFDSRINSFINRSGAIMLPFMSTIILFMEFGLFGLTFFILAFFKIYKLSFAVLFSSSKNLLSKINSLVVIFMIPYMFTISFFDKYFEYPQVMLLFYLTISLVLIDYNLLSNEYLKRGLGKGG